MKGFARRTNMGPTAHPVGGDPNIVRSKRKQTERSFRTGIVPFWHHKSWAPTDRCHKTVASISPPPSAVMSEPSEILALAGVSKKALTGVFRFRASHGLDVEQVLIYLALGAMNLEGSQDSVVTVQPVNIATVCQAIALPRETVRRKLIQLEDQKLVRRAAAGFFIDDLNRWVSLARTLVVT